MINWKYILSVTMILVSPAYSKMSAETKKICNMAHTCYMDIVQNSGDKRPYTIRMEKGKCDRLKKECDRLLKIKDDPQTNLEHAYNTYQKAFKRYTSMVTTSPAQNESVVQQALQEYRDSYARYKQIKDNQGETFSKPVKKTGNLDTTGIDGIVDFDPSDVENNIAYIERLRSHTEDQTKPSINVPVEVKQKTDRCKSKEFKDFQLDAVEAFQEDKSEMALELFKKAYSICPTKEVNETIELLNEEIK